MKTAFFTLFLCGAVSASAGSLELLDGARLDGELHWRTNGILVKSADGAETVVVGPKFSAIVMQGGGEVNGVGSLEAAMGGAKIGSLQKDIEVLIDKLDQMNVAARSIQTPGSQTETLYRIWTERNDRKRPIILFCRGLNVSLTSGAAKLELQIRPNQLEKLLSHLKSNSVNP